MSNPAFIFDHVHIIARDPRGSAKWYVDMLGATITDDTTAYGAPQIFLELGGAIIIIRSVREGENVADTKPIKSYGKFSSHAEWGTDHFGYLYKGDLTAFCAELRAKGVQFPVELKRGLNGSLLCYISAPDNVSIELMEC
jgi:catechol 2,3-dioxygenase-like lactoylglutathione lyase family enzyme